MRSFNEYITEVFNNPFKFRVQGGDKKSSFYAFNSSEGDVILVKFFQNNYRDPSLGTPALAPRSFEVSFTNNTKNLAAGPENNPSDVTNRGEAFRIFATLGIIIEDFIKKMKPDAIIFFSKAANRSKLYKAMLKKTKIPKYTTSSSGSSTNKAFIIIQKNINDDEVIDDIIDTFS